MVGLELSESACNSACHHFYFLFALFAIFSHVNKEASGLYSHRYVSALIAISVIVVKLAYPVNGCRHIGCDV